MRPTKNFPIKNVLNAGIHDLCLTSHLTPDVTALERALADGRATAFAYPKGWDRHIRLYIDRHRWVDVWLTQHRPHGAAVKIGVKADEIVALDLIAVVRLLFPRGPLAFVLSRLRIQRVDCFVDLAANTATVYQSVLVRHKLQSQVVADKTVRMFRIGTGRHYLRGYDRLHRAPESAVEGLDYLTRLEFQIKDAGQHLGITTALELLTAGVNKNPFDILDLHTTPALDTTDVVNAGIVSLIERFGFHQARRMVGRYHWKQRVESAGTPLDVDSIKLTFAAGLDAWRAPALTLPALDDIARRKGAFVDA